VGVGTPDFASVISNSGAGIFSVAGAGAAAGAGPDDTDSVFSTTLTGVFDLAFDFDFELDGFWVEAMVCVFTVSK